MAQKLQYTDDEMTLADGGIYRGMRLTLNHTLGYMKDGKRHGPGSYLFKDGNKYNGEWMDDKQEGYGMLQKNDGSVYEGRFKNSKAHGTGTFRYALGAVFVG